MASQVGLNILLCSIVHTGKCNPDSLIHFPIRKILAKTHGVLRFSRSTVTSAGAGRGWCSLAYARLLAVPGQLAALDETPISSSGPNFLICDIEYTIRWLLNLPASKGKVISISCPWEHAPGWKLPIPAAQGWMSSCASAGRAPWQPPLLSQEPALNPETVLAFRLGNNSLTTSVPVWERKILWSGAICKLYQETKELC